MIHFRLWLYVVQHSAMITLKFNSHDSFSNSPSLLKIVQLNLICSYFWEILSLEPDGGCIVINDGFDHCNQLTTTVVKSSCWEL
jgi:hypothetical protein